MRFIIVSVLILTYIQANAYEYYYVSTGSLNIRKEGSSHSDVIGTLSIRDSVQVILLKEHGWSYILTKNGLDGYVSTKYLTKDKNEIGPSHEAKNENLDKSKGEEEASPTTILLLIVGFIGAIYMAFFRNKSTTSSEPKNIKPQYVKQKKITLYWFQCERCGKSIRQSDTPRSAGCPSDKRSHVWYKLAEVGDVNYQCERCGTSIYATSSPRSAGCPSSEMSHIWYKL